PPNRTNRPLPNYPHNRQFFPGPSVDRRNDVPVFAGGFALPPCIVMNTLVWAGGGNLARRNAGAVADATASRGPRRVNFCRSGANMKRWKLRLLGLGLAALGGAGCKEQLFEREGDRHHYQLEALKPG